ncbi:g11903 [Coccomyxa viridis]|uniref:G11903 protein n=1 Tax=Coccomyxa viridis TaxID=1274662 RepID=A0ABP1GBR2_9CHLO
MLPARKTPCDPGSFFGKSYPRALGKLDEDSRLIKGPNTEMPNKPFLQWAKKVDWKQGGTAARPAGKPPKAPITALEAYVQYLRSQALKSVRSHAPDQEEQHSSVAILKEEAAQQAENDWATLDDEEKRIFEDIAKEDAMRFQVEAVAHELRNPGWFKGWLARQGTPAGHAASGSRVKPPMTPWMAFVHVVLSKLKEKDSVLAASVSKIELMRLAMSEASPLYKKLTEEEKAGYVKLAEEDKARYERELQENPEAQRKLEKKAKARAADARANKPALKVRRSKKQPAAEAPEEVVAEVDTTGLTTVQVWAARRAAKRAGEKKNTVTARKAAPTPAPRKRATAKPTAVDPAEEAAAEPEGEDIIQATPAELPDHAYIRTQATGEDWETQSSSEEEQGSESESDEADSGAEDGQGEPSVIADTIGSLEEPMTQDNADSGVLGKVQGLVTAGLKWLTTGRKRRGVLTSMQAEGFKATPRKLEAEYENRRASKRRRQ